MGWPCWSFIIDLFLDSGLGCPILSQGMWGGFCICVFYMCMISTSITVKIMFIYYYLYVFGSCITCMCNFVCMFVCIYVCARVCVFSCLYYVYAYAHFLLSSLILTRLLIFEFFMFFLNSVQWYPFSYKIKK